MSRRGICSGAFCFLMNISKMRRLRRDEEGDSLEVYLLYAFSNGQTPAVFVRLMMTRILTQFSSYSSHSFKVLG